MLKLYYASYTSDDFYVEDIVVGAKGFHEDFDLEIIEKVTVQAVIKTDKQLDLDYFYEYEYDLMGLFIMGDCNIYVLFKQEEEIDEIPEHEVIQYC